ncbi:MAG: hypothetical protein ABR985_03600 [Methanotrichaceae archaeon]|jgi:hypothetical protein
MKWGDPVSPDPNSKTLKRGLYLIDASIDQVDTPNDFKAVSTIAQELDYTKEQLEALLK